MADKRATIPREIGRTGLRYTTKNIVDDELAPELRWPHSLTTFDKMKSDPLVSGSLMMIKQYIRKVEWDIQPVGGVNASDEDKATAEIIRDALFMRMARSWDQVVADILSFIEYGFSFHEPTYKVYKGNFIWKDFPSRSQKTISGFKFDERGNLDQIKQCPANLAGFTPKATTEIEIPYSRLLHFRTDSERNNPLGRSILKNAYYAWDKKTKLEYYEAVGIEREMNGLPVFRIPMEYFMADPQEDPDRYKVFQDFIRIGTNVRNNEQACLFLPSDTDETSNKELFNFDLVASRGTRSIDTSKVIERYDYRIAQSMLSDFILMGSSSSGSFALSDNKIGTFIQTLEAYLEIIAEQFNRKAIPTLYRMNGWDDTRTCKLVHKPIGSASLADLGAFLQNVGGFISADKHLENAIRKRADLPERDDSSTFLDTPVNVHQAISQRIGMTKNANEEAATASPQELVEQDDALVDNLMKALEGTYQGDA
jgi:hypothetical protein